MSLSLRIRNQYIETLIKLIELNNDHAWDFYFLRLREGGSLPGGGAGSLNDWSPSYSDQQQEVWLREIYEVTRYLFAEDFEPTRIESSPSIKYKHHILAIRCANCSKSFQHSRVFECYLALDFLKDNYAAFAYRHKLIEILEPAQSYSSEQILKYRVSLLNEYRRNDIKVFDFVSAKYLCPHCGKDIDKAEHESYKVIKTALEDKNLVLVKSK